MGESGFRGLGTHCGGSIVVKRELEFERASRVDEVECCSIV
jgi:hypothetical protein